MRYTERSIFRLVAAVWFIFFGCGTLVRADSWVPPTTETYLSANGQYRLTIVPRNLDSQLEYFETKVKGDCLPENLGPTGKLEHLAEGVWVQLWQQQLVNEVAPVRALVSDDGKRVITFDNWHSVGHGDDVVVLYNEGGVSIKALALEDIVPSYFVDGFPRSVSSIRWRESDPKIAGEKLHFAFKSPDHKQGKGIDFRVSMDLTDGKIDPITDEMMGRLSPSFCAAHSQDVKEFNEWKAFQRADLVRPSTDDDDQWDRYLAQAIQRLKPDEKPRDEELWLGETEFELLLPGEYMEKDFRKSFEEALVAPATELQRRWFASKDQERMTLLIEKMSKKLRPEQLSGTDMRFFADKEHWLRIEKALKGSGALLTQVDTQLPIPQKREAISDLPEDRKIDRACLNFPDT